MQRESISNSPVRLGAHRGPAEDREFTSPAVNKVRPRDGTQGPMPPLRFQVKSDSKGAAKHNTGEMNHSTVDGNARPQHP